MAWELAWSWGDGDVALWLCCELSALVGCRSLVPTEVSPGLRATFYTWLGM